jgi:hypothetical protein
MSVQMTYVLYNHVNDKERNFSFLLACGIGVASHLCIKHRLLLKMYHGKKKNGYEEFTVKIFTIV